MTTKPKFSDQIRQAIEDCGQSRYEIWKATGIDQAALSKFMSGKRGLSTRALDTLAEHLGFELRVTTKRKGR